MLYLAPLGAKYMEKREKIQKNAGFSPEGWLPKSKKLNFQAVIKSAASAASRKAKSLEGSSRGAQDGGSAGGRRPRGTPLELPSLDLGFLEAALAANLITA